MKVVRHEAERMYFDAEQLAAFVNKRQESIAVRRGKKRSLTICAAVHHVMPTIFRIQTERSPHTTVWI